MATLLSGQGLVLHIDKPSSGVVRQWAQLAFKLSPLGYRVALVLAGRKAWKLRGSIPSAPLTVLVDENLSLAKLLGIVKMIPIIGLSLGVEPATMVISRFAGTLKIEIAKGGGDGFSHTLWALEAASKLARSSVEV